MQEMMIERAKSILEGIWKESREWREIGMLDKADRVRNQWADTLEAYAKLIGCTEDELMF